MKPKKVPLWNWIVLLFPLGGLVHALFSGVPLAFAWNYALGNLGYLLAVVTVYPGRFLLFGLTTRLGVFIIALVSWLTSFVFTNLLL